MRRNSIFYGTAFGMLLLALLIIPPVFSEDVTSSVTITGVSPSVGPISYSDNVDLSSCGTVTVWCNATITDANGWNDIRTVNATLWDSVSTTEESSDDSSNHYMNNSCGMISGSGSTAQANCSFALQYYANATNWTCKVYANDSSGNVDSNTTYDNVTINTLRALDAEDTINFGSLAPGGTSPEDVNNTVTNCGNAPIDLNLTGTNITNASASVTNISVGNVKYNVTDWNQSYTDNMTSLTETSTHADFTLAKRTNGVSTNKTYWKITIPAVIENFVYTGNITFTAVVDT
jgi:hypothetical protein